MNDKKIISVIVFSACFALTCFAQQGKAGKDNVHLAAASKGHTVNRTTLKHNVAANTPVLQTATPAPANHAAKPAPAEMKAAEKGSKQPNR